MEKDKIKTKICDLWTKISQKFYALDFHDSNLKKRIISSMIMLPLAIYAIYFSQNLFLFLAISLAILMSYEWLDMSKNMPNQTKWRVIGFLYIAVPIYAVTRLRFIDGDIILWMFLIIWTTDICAYFVGKAIGGKKLAPSISPGKTWSGFIGGLISSLIVATVTSLMFSGGIEFFVIIAAVISIVSQLSDLLESKFKRIFDVKDSSQMIPGHGGVLDRLDAIMLVAPLLLVLVEIFGDKFGL